MHGYDAFITAETLTQFGDRLINAARARVKRETPNLSRKRVARKILSFMQAKTVEKLRWQLAHCG